MNKGKSVTEVCKLLDMISAKHKIEFENGELDSASAYRKAFNKVIIRSDYPVSQIYYTMHTSEKTTNHTKELFDIYMNENNANCYQQFQRRHSNFPKQDATIEKQA